MAVVVKFDDRKLQKALNGASVNGVKRASLFYQSAMKRAVNKSNQRGTRPSIPGEPPHKFTGFGQSNIFWRMRKGLFGINDIAEVGVGGNAMYMFLLDQGTNPKVIEPRQPGKMLMIPWRKNREPTPEEIKELGLKKLVPPRGGRKQWFMFRPRARTPGTKPRPFFLPTLYKNSNILARLAASP